MAMLAPSPPLPFPSLLRPCRASASIHAVRRHTTSTRGRLAAVVTLRSPSSRRLVHRRTQACSASNVRIVDVGFVQALEGRYRGSRLPLAPLGLGLVPQGFSASSIDRYHFTPWVRHDQ